jgi:hypothetical protein
MAKLRRRVDNVKRYLLKGDRVVRPLDVGEVAPNAQVLRSARPVRVGARVCKAPQGARVRADLYLPPMLVGRVLEAAGGLSVRAWIAAALERVDLDTCATMASTGQASQLVRTSFPLLVTDDRYRDIKAVSSAARISVQALARSALELAVLEG